MAIDHADAGEVRLDELLQDPSSFDGRRLVLHGTLTKLHTHVSRKGDRYYTFSYGALFRPDREDPPGAR